MAVVGVLRRAFFAGWVLGFLSGGYCGRAWVERPGNAPKNNPLGVPPFVFSPPPPPALAYIMADPRA